MNNKTLCLFTQSFPYGIGEPFIENELNVIAPYFNEVYIFPKNQYGNLKKLPTNAHVVLTKLPDSETKKKNFLKNIFTISSLLLKELFLSRQKKLFFQKFRYNLSYLTDNICYSEQINSFVKDKKENNFFFYSYWFYDWNFSLSFLKHSNKIKYNYTRAHGFDLYENNGKPNYLPFRKFCLNNTDRIFTVSKLGKNYLEKIYPSSKPKTECYYLGTLDYGINPLPFINDPIHIVSCSTTVAVKRIHLIIEILKHCSFNVKWTHIGDGNLQEEIIKQSKKLSDNCIVNFTGRLSSSEIVSFYKETPIDIFINCSISEGLPVSIMEAISFGIPVIATDVGGTKEIVNKNTGYLIEAEIDFKSTAALIENIRSAQIDREKIKGFWKNSFFAEKNYLSFVQNEFLKINN